MWQAILSVCWKHDVGVPWNAALPRSGCPRAGSGGQGRSSGREAQGQEEGQPGKRKAASQEYHGRGAIHIHAVLFAEDAAAVQLHKKLHASELPVGHPLRGFVLDQLSHSGSGWPVHEEESCWDAANELCRLHHTEQDQAQGVRAFGLEEVDVLKSHVDNLMCQENSDKGRGLMMRYVATYNTKFSSSFHNEAGVLKVKGSKDKLFYCVI